MVAGREAGGAGSECFDNAGGFVAEHHGHGARADTFDDGEIRMAQAGGGDADEEFAGAGGREFQRFDVQRAGLGVGARQAHLAQQGGTGFHIGALVWPTDGKCKGLDRPPVRIPH